MTKTLVATNQLDPLRIQITYHASGEVTVAKEDCPEPVRWLRCMDSGPNTMWVPVFGKNGWRGRLSRRRRKKMLQRPTSDGWFNVGIRPV